MHLNLDWFSAHPIASVTGLVVVPCGKLSWLSVDPASNTVRHARISPRVYSVEVFFHARIFQISYSSQI